MNQSHRPLDPLERSSEVLFGLIMALSFTGSLSVASAGREEVRTMLAGALGCNLAWGLVDAVMYVLANLMTRARGLTILKRIRATSDPATGRRIIADALPPLVASALQPAHFEHLRQELLAARELPARALPSREDLRGAVAVFLLVFLSTFPLVIPFIFVRQPLLALRLSNATAMLMMFTVGHRLGRYAGYHPTGLGLTMVMLGGMLVAMTIALGG